MFDSFVPQHEDFLLALQMNEEQYQKVFLNLNKFIYSRCIHWAFQCRFIYYIYIYIKPPLVNLRLTQVTVSVTAKGCYLHTRPKQKWKDIDMFSKSMNRNSLDSC